MRGKIVLAGLIAGPSGAVASAQVIAAEFRRPNDLYCSGSSRRESVPRDTYVITGEESNDQIIVQSKATTFTSTRARTRA